MTRKEKISMYDTIHRRSRHRARSAISIAFAVGLAASAGSTAAPAGARAETANYVAEIAPGGAYKAGTEGTVKVTIVAKGDYHINPEYPYKFKAAAPAA